MWVVYNISILLHYVRTLHRTRFEMNTYSLISGLTSNMYKLNIFKRSSPIHEVLFYGGEDEDKTKKIGLDNLFCITYVIVHASSSVDICVPSLMSDTITKCLVNLRQKNKIKIRVAVHNCKKLRNAALLWSAGIEVKVVKSDERLGHDFILIDANDNDAVAVLGSLDYEISRVNHNRDATLLTSESTVVKTLQREFERVWISTDNVPNKMKHANNAKENEVKLKSSLEV